MKRPTGVTVIAIVLFVLAGLAGMTALGAALAGIDPGMLPPELQDIPLPPDVISKVIAIAFLIIAAVMALLGTGLWFLKNWVRRTAIVLGGIEAFFGAVQVLALAVRAEDLMLLFGMVRLGAIVWVVWYLVQPPVKAAFVSTPVNPDDISPPMPPRREPPATPPEGV